MPPSAIIDPNKVILLIFSLIMTIDRKIVTMGKSANMTAAVEASVLCRPEYVRRLDAAGPRKVIIRILGRCLRSTEIR